MNNGYYLYEAAKQEYLRGNVEGALDFLEEAADICSRSKDPLYHQIKDVYYQLQGYGVNPFEAKFGVCPGCGEDMARTQAEYYTKFGKITDPKKNRWVIHNQDSCFQTARQIVPPECPEHGTMNVKTGQYGPYWACSGKLSDGTWCKSKPPHGKGNWRDPNQSSTGPGRPSRLIPSAYQGSCRICSNIIKIKDPITPWKNNNANIWVHVGCENQDILAQHQQPCMVCREDIQEGESITVWRDQKAIWVHDACAGGEIQIEIPEKFKNFTPSHHQARIRDAYINTNFHIIIDAKAGSGKTTTLEWLIASTYAHPPKRILMMAFNRSIAKELNNRVRTIPGVEASTLNAHGYKLVLRAYGAAKNLTSSKIKLLAQRPGIGPDGQGFPFKKEDQHRIALVGKDREALIKRNRMMVNLLQKIVDMVKANLAAPEEYEELIQRYKIPVEELSPEDYNILLQTIPQLLEANIKSAVDRELLDFNDQIWLPVVGAFQQETGIQILTPEAMSLLKNIRFPTGIDVLFVDESQDLNRCQQELSLKTIGKTGKLIAVGDPFQSIYAFSGADSQSMPRLFKLLSETPRSCSKMDLSITFRCPKAVVRHAQEILNTVIPAGIPVISPDQATIEAAPGAPEGLVRSLPEDVVFDNITAEADAELRRDRKGGTHVPTMILSRTNAPIFGAALSLLGRGVPVKIIGRDVCKALLEYIDDINPKGNDNIRVYVNALKERLAAIGQLERELIQSGDLDPEDELSSPFQKEKDQIAAIYILACGGPPSDPCLEKAASVAELKKDLDALFNGGRCPKANLHPGTSTYVADAADEICPICISERNEVVPVLKRSGVVFSTIHKAKGLEALKIYILDPSRLGRPRPASSEEDQRQEIHLWYVAVTRVKFAEDKDSGVLTYLEEPGSRGLDGPRNDEPESRDSDYREMDTSIAPELPMEEPVETEDLTSMDPLLTASHIRTLSLPRLPTKGSGAYLEPTMTVWKQIRDMYRNIGIPAKFVQIPGWKQYSLLVNGIACANTTIDVGMETARTIGKKPIKVLEPDSRGRFYDIEGSKILRVEGWQGRTIERINAILSRRDPIPADAQAYHQLKEHAAGSSARRYRRR